MASGKVDVRVNQSTGKARLRFYGVALDQLELIRAALDVARKRYGTTNDTVALEAMAMEYLGSAHAALLQSGEPIEGQVCN